VLYGVRVLRGLIDVRAALLVVVEVVFLGLSTVMTVVYATSRSSRMRSRTSATVASPRSHT